MARVIERYDTAKAIPDMTDAVERDIRGALFCGSRYATGTFLKIMSIDFRA